ncbi:hypothetical protein QYE76_014838 [Lolium multiflorum]|uniref:Uncharacterized protein n=1 Tax=Lolium multiflorum TaxID=4521 RepID=A0AAD8U391_LOLMU|nr:hypothetical protein QYE76_014838 [Lolium multiflorum]
MPPWDRFRELCLLRFGPLIHGSRLTELGRLPFTTTVQDFVERFQALACHAPGVTGQQRVDLFIGGLPDHVRVDVELQAPKTSRRRCTMPTPMSAAHRRCITGNRATEAARLPGHHRLPRGLAGRTRPLQR